VCSSAHASADDCTDGTADPICTITNPISSIAFAHAVAWLPWRHYGGMPGFMPGGRRWLQSMREGVRQSLSI